MKCAGSTSRLRGPVVLLGATLACLATGPAAAAGAPPGTGAPLGLADVLRLAAGHSAAADVAAAEVAAVEAVADRVRAGRWPTVDLSAAYTMRDNPIEAQAGDLRFPTAEKNSGQYAVEAREVVWDGGRRSQAEAAALAQVEATRLGGLAGVQQAQLGAVDAYLAALESAGAAHVLEQRRDALRAHLDVVRDMLSHGLVARNDVLETEVRAREVDDLLAAVADRRDLAVRDLGRRLGRDPGDVFTLPDSLPEAPPLADDREQLATAAAGGNASILAATAWVRAGESMHRLAQRSGRPSLFVGATHAFSENRFMVHENINALQAGVHWNVFDGGARKADAGEAAARTRVAARQKLETERATRVAVDGAWRRWEQARRELQTARANVEAARENLRLVADQYREGLARSGDVLDAEALLAQSRHDVVRRHYAAYRSQAELLLLAGRDATAFYGDAAASTGKE